MNIKLRPAFTRALSKKADHHLRIGNNHHPDQLHEWGLAGRQYLQSDQEEEDEEDHLDGKETSR